MAQRSALQAWAVTLSAVVALAAPLTAAVGDPWVDLGNALPGTHGAPTLTPTGLPIAGAQITLTVDDARAASTAFWAVGLSEISLPFMGGVFVPAPDILIVMPTGGTAGVPASFLLRGDFPSGVPSGTEFSFQCWISDPDGPAGFAGTNALRGTALQLRDILSDEIDARLAAAAPPAISKPIYTTQDFGTHTYVRNPNCWAADIDLTGLSPWNSLEANRRAGTLVSPRHVVFAKHYQITPGSQLDFVTADNVTVTRTLGGVLNPGGDISIGILDADVPPEISFLKVWPRDWADYLWEIPQLAMLHLDQEEQALVRDCFFIVESTKTVIHTDPVDPTRLAFSETLIGGDSGNPACFIVDGEAVLMLTHHTAGSGPFYTAWFDELNAAMASLGGGYQLTEFDLGAFVQD